MLSVIPLAELLTSQCLFTVLIPYKDFPYFIDKTKNEFEWGSWTVKLTNWSKAKKEIELKRRQKILFPNIMNISLSLQVGNFFHWLVELLIGVQAVLNEISLKIYEKTIHTFAV